MGGSTVLIFVHDAIALNSSPGEMVSPDIQSMLSSYPRILTPLFVLSELTFGSIKRSNSIHSPILFMYNQCKYEHIERVSHLSSFLNQ